jgi:hypothetical protein
MIGTLSRLGDKDVPSACGKDRRRRTRGWMAAVRFVARNPGIMSGGSLSRKRLSKRRSARAQSCWRRLRDGSLAGQDEVRGSTPRIFALQALCPLGRSDPGHDWFVISSQHPNEILVAGGPPQRQRRSRRDKTCLRASIALASIAVALPASAADRTPVRQSDLRHGPIICRASKDRCIYSSNKRLPARLPRP